MPKPKNPNADQEIKEIKENVYAANTSGQKYHMVVPMLQKTQDGKELHLPMVILTPREQNEVEAKAYADTRSMFREIPKKDEPGVDAWTKIMDDNRAAYTLFYATRLPTDLSKKWFMDKQQVEDTYTPEEAGILCNHYLTVKLNQPHLKVFDPSNPDAFQGIIDVIRRDGENSDFFLNGLTTHSANQLVKYLVSQLTNSQKDNGSLGPL